MMHPEDFTDHEQAMVLASRSRVYIPNIKAVLEEYKAHKLKEDQRRSLLHNTRKLISVMRNLTIYHKDSTEHPFGWTSEDAPALDLVIESNAILREFTMLVTPMLEPMFTTVYEKKVFSTLRQVAADFVESVDRYDAAYQLERFREGVGFAEFEIAIQSMANLGTSPRNQIESISLEHAFI
jgi:hypothetical protein